MHYAPLFFLLCCTPTQKFEFLTPVPPPPAPKSSSELSFKTSEVFLIQTDKQYICKPPAGLQVTEDIVPSGEKFSFRANFADIGVKRVYISTPFAYSITSSVPGDYSLTLIPVGLKSVDELKTLSFKVKGDAEPPPPKPSDEINNVVIIVPNDGTPLSNLDFEAIYGKETRDLLNQKYPAKWIIYPAGSSMSPAISAQYGPDINKKPNNLSLPWSNLGSISELKSKLKAK